MGFFSKIKLALNADKDFGQLDQKKEKELRENAKQEYYKAKQDQMKRLAKARAKLETDRRVKQIKQRLSFDIKTNIAGRDRKRKEAQTQVHKLMSMDDAITRVPKKKKQSKKNNNNQQSQNFLDQIMKM